MAGIASLAAVLVAAPALATGHLGGPEFAVAVRALAVGEISAPFRSSHGWHVARLERKQVTRFDDVRARVLELWREEPPTLAERQRTIEALLTDYGATRPLRR